MVISDVKMVKKKKHTKKTAKIYKAAVISALH